jgi:hypothetical protein
VEDLQHELQGEIETKLQALRERMLGIERDVAETIRREKVALTSQHLDGKLKVLEAIEAIDLLQEQVVTKSAAAQDKLARLEEEMQADSRQRHQEELHEAQLLAEEQHARDSEADAHKRNRFAEEMRASQEQVRFDAFAFNCMSCVRFRSHVGALTWQRMPAAKARAGEAGARIPLVTGTANRARKAAAPREREQVG